MYATHYVYVSLYVCALRRRTRGRVTSYKSCQRKLNFILSLLFSHVRVTIICLFAVWELKANDGFCMAGLQIAY